jgi:hypothetical protein
MDNRISKDQFIDMLEHPQHNLGRWIDGTVASPFLGGEVDTGKFDESDFAALHKAVIDVGSEEVGRFVVYCLERLYELSIEDLDAPLDDNPQG